MFVQFLLDFNIKVHFAQVFAFSKVAKIEGEVFVAFRASQDDLEPSRATILPQSPCSLTPDIIVSKFFRLSCEKSVQSMCYQKIYIKVYLMHTRAPPSWALYAHGK